MADLSGRDLVWLERRRAELYGLIARVGDFRRGALNLPGALLADCSAEGAQIINSAPIQAASRWNGMQHEQFPYRAGG